MLWMGAGMTFRARARVLDADDVARVVKRISHEILERNKGSSGLALVGVRTRGVFLARRFASTIGETEMSCSLVMAPICRAPPDSLM